MYYSNTVIQPNINTNLSEMERIERKRLTGSYELPDPSTPYTIRAATYVRVSTSPQAEDDKASLPNQRKTTLELIEHNQWNLFKRYEDVKHTSDEENPYEREGLSQALEDASKGLFDVLVVWVDSRLGRNYEEIQGVRKTFRLLGVQTYSVLKPLPVIDPRFYSPKVDKFRMWQEGVNDLSSAAESAEFAEKMQFGKLKKARDGYIPGRLGFGYEIEKGVELDGAKQKFVTKTKVNESKLAIVSEIFELYLKQSYGIRKICEILNEKNCPGPKNGKWNYSTVRYILKNPLYAGKVRWGWKLSEFRRSKQRLAKGHNGIISDGHHVAIINEEDFIKIQKKIEQRAKLGGRAVASKGLLVGLLKCSICGGGAYITSSPSMYAYKKEKMGELKDKFAKIHYYVCSTVSKYGNKACKRYICSQQKIEEMVVNEIRSLVKSSDAQKSFEKTIVSLASKDTTIKEKTILQELAKFPLIKDRYSRAFGEGYTKLEDYGKQISELADREKQLNRELSEVQAEKEENKLIKEKVSKAISIFRNFDSIWNQATFEVKKDLLRGIIKKIVYSKAKLKIEYQI